MIEYRCPNCRQEMMSPDSLAGRVEDCPDCGTGVAVPASTVFGVQQGEVAEPDGHDEPGIFLEGVVLCMKFVGLVGAFLVHLFAAFAVDDHYDSILLGLLAFCLPFVGTVWALIITIWAGSWSYSIIVAAWLAFVVIRMFVVAAFGLKVWLPQEGHPQ